MVIKISNEIPADAHKILDKIKWLEAALLERKEDKDKKPNPKYVDNRKEVVQRIEKLIKAYNLQNRMYQLYRIKISKKKAGELKADELLKEYNSLINALKTTKNSQITNLEEIKRRIKYLAKYTRTKSFCFQVGKMIGEFNKQNFYSFSPTPPPANFTFLFQKSNGYDQNAIWNIPGTNQVFVSTQMGDYQGANTDVASQMHGALNGFITANGYGGAGNTNNAEKVLANDLQVGANDPTYQINAIVKFLNTISSSGSYKAGYHDPKNNIFHKIGADLSHIVQQVVKVATNITGDVVFAPLLPFLGMMKDTLRKKGISPGPNIAAIAAQFAENIVKPSQGHFEVPGDDVNNFINAQKKDALRTIDNFSEMVNENPDFYVGSKFRKANLPAMAGLMAELSPEKYNRFCFSMARSAPRSSAIYKQAAAPAAAMSKALTVANSLAPSAARVSDLTPALAVAQAAMPWAAGYPPGGDPGSGSGSGGGGDSGGGDPATAQALSDIQNQLSTLQITAATQQGINTNNPPADPDSGSSFDQTEFNIIDDIVSIIIDFIKGLAGKKKASPPGPPLTPLEESILGLAQKASDGVLSTGLAGLPDAGADPGAGGGGGGGGGGGKAKDDAKLKINWKMIMGIGGGIALLLLIVILVIPGKKPAASAT